MSRKLVFRLSLFILLSSLLCVGLNSVEVKAVHFANESNYVTVQEVDGEIHDVAVVNVSLSVHEAYIGQKISIEVVVRNEGNLAEKFNVTINANQTSESIFVDSYIVTSLGSLVQISIPFVWELVGVAPGKYTVKAEASVVDGETDIVDNIKISSLIWVRADDTAPVIGVPVQNPLPDAVLQYEWVAVSVNVWDLGSGVLRVVVSWKVNDETVWRNATMIHITGDMYEEFIHGYVGDTYISYRIIAYDKAGHEAVRDNGGFYYVYCVIPEFPSLVILLMFMIATLLAVIVYRRKRQCE